MDPMTSSMPRRLDQRERAEMRQWLENWRQAGAFLEHEHRQRLEALTDEDAWRETQSLFALWEPGMTGDAGEGLLLQQRVFAGYADRARR